MYNIDNYSALLRIQYMHAKLWIDLKLKEESMYNKPVYINVFTFAFPVTAIVSILHRISGVFLLFMIWLFLGLLQDTLYYPWHNYFNHKCIIWAALSIFIYHFFAGIRHLLMDLGLGEDKGAARKSSYVVLALSVLCSLFIWLSLC